MSSEIAVKVSHLSKCYPIYNKPRDRLLQMLSFGQKKFYREFWALKDVSFEIKKGETVGIIGRNGSGKSTLLQMICGTLNPTSGHVETHGRVAALLELGSGFNPEFTGRENVYMNASILGLSKHDIQLRLDDILAFADIGDFIDQPVKSYSSGMMVRLAFAVIAHVDADILIIDEALAVGDVFFQQKCMRYLRQLQNKGATVIFVSHDTAAVMNLCKRAILLSKDNGAILGATDEISKRYIKSLYEDRQPTQLIHEPNDNACTTPQPLTPYVKASTQTIFSGGELPENMIHIAPFNVNQDSFGHGGVKILNVWFENEESIEINTVHGGEAVKLCIIVKSFQNIQWPAFGFMLKDRLGQYVIAEGTDLAFREHGLVFQKDDVVQVTFSFDMPILMQGEYSLNFAVSEGLGHAHVQHHWINDAIILNSIKSRLVHGICGLKNLSIEIQINSENQAL